MSEWPIVVRFSVFLLTVGIDHLPPACPLPLFKLPRVLRPVRPRLLGPGRVSEAAGEGPGVRGTAELVGGGEGQHAVAVGETEKEIMY